MENRFELVEIGTFYEGWFRVWDREDNELKMCYFISSKEENWNRLYDYLGKTSIPIQISFGVQDKNSICYFTRFLNN